MIMWNRRRVKRQAQADAAGFTLLEVLVAVAIVAIVLVTFMGLHLRSLDAAIRAQDLTTAVLLAQAKMATMGEFPDTGEEQGKFEGPELERFQWSTAVTEHILDALEGGQTVTVRRLEVTVYWADGQQTRHYTLEAYGVRQAS
jgi:general secretion pathway protein I